MAIDPGIDPVTDAPVDVGEEKTVIPDGALPVGKTDFAAVEIVEAADSLNFAIDTTDHTDPDAIISGTIEISHDDGKTWDVLASFTRTGGPGFARDGKTPVFDAGITISGIKAGKTRLVRGYLSSTKQLATSAKLIPVKADVVIEPALEEAVK